MRTIVRKWGNGAAVRIPRGILKTLQLSLGEVVNVRAKSGQIVIQPIRTRKMNLAKLLAAITPQNLHAAADFEDSVGRESW